MSFRDRLNLHFFGGTDVELMSEVMFYGFLFGAPLLTLAVLIYG